MPTSWPVNNTIFSAETGFTRKRADAADFYVDTDYRLIYEDEAILVVDKPAPLAVHPVGAYAEKNLHSLLKKDPRWQNTPLHCTHRLDAETSGVILIAKNHDAARFIGKEFLASRVRKKYRALVFGNPKELEGEIDYKLGRDLSSGFQTVRIRDEENGEEARTKYKVLKQEDGYAWVEVWPLTGRTHQIRAHLALWGHPIVGDKIYLDLSIFQRYVMNGLDETMLARLKLPRLALHAESLELRHPLYQEDILFCSEVPDFYKRIIP